MGRLGKLRCFNSQTQRVLFHDFGKSLTSLVYLLTFLFVFNNLVLNEFVESWVVGITLLVYDIVQNLQLLRTMLTLLQLTWQGNCLYLLRLHEILKHTIFIILYRVNAWHSLLLKLSSIFSSGIENQWVGGLMKSIFLILFNLEASSKLGRSYAILYRIGLKETFKLFYFWRFRTLHIKVYNFHLRLFGLFIFLHVGLTSYACLRGPALNIYCLRRKNFALPIFLGNKLSYLLMVFCNLITLR